MPDSHKSSHPHREVVIAYANGARVQCRNPLWRDIEYPGFLPGVEYRVRPDEAPRPEPLLISISVPVEGAPPLRVQIEAARADTHGAVHITNVEVKNWSQQ
jgi:hypothetical protein